MPGALWQRSPKLRGLLEPFGGLGPWVDRRNSWGPIAATHGPIAGADGIAGARGAGALGYRACAVVKVDSVAGVHRIAGGLAVHRAHGVPAAHGVAGALGSIAG